MRHLSFSDFSVLVTFLFCWHYSFGDISLLVAFQFWWNFSLVTCQVWWHSSFGDITVLMPFQFSWFFFVCFWDISTVYCLLSTFYCLLSIFYCLQSTVYRLLTSIVLFDCLGIPRALPADFNIPSQGAQTTNNKTPNIEPLQICLTGWNWEIWISTICVLTPHFNSL